MGRSVQMLALASALLLVLSACSKEKDTGFNNLPKPKTSSAGSTVTGISIAAGNKFDPTPFQAKVGQPVTWTYSDSSGQPHNVVADDGSFDSSPQCQKDATKCMGQTGEPTTFTWTPKKAGKYPYYCVIHGGKGGIGMAGEVDVT
jgi:plastocyanin